MYALPRQRKNNAVTQLQMGSVLICLRSAGSAVPPLINFLTDGVRRTNRKNYRASPTSSGGLVGPKFTLYSTLSNNTRSPAKRQVNVMASGVS